MKSKLLAFLMLPTLASAELEVHEWGTFTTLSDATGSVLQWYSPQSDHSALPTFVVTDPMFMKSAMMTRVRMETPVIYFYPDRPMEVEVTATYHNGNITEIYPANIRKPYVPVVSTDLAANTVPVSSFGTYGASTIPTYWKGNLLPPNDVDALAMIPAVSSGERGAHYAAAREVPDAWIFHHKAQKYDPESQKTLLVDQADKFIFYRGAGNTTSGLVISNPSTNSIHLTNYGEYDYKLGVLLEVRGDKARWSPMPSISKKGDDVKLVPTTITGEWQPVSQTETELTQWFQHTLSSKGLTTSEAAAMIATWHGTWFRETGLRVFTLMPRAEVDALLPLEITPSPKKLERVFVNRHELITHDQEQELTSLMLDLRIENKDAKSRLQQLDLGRFEQAAIQRAVQIGQSRMYERYQLISKKETH